MSSFKEIKKTSNIKVYESKVKRLYASEALSEEDLKYLNIQFDYYTMRKSYINVFTGACGIIGYNFPLIRELHKYKRLSFAICVMTTVWIVFRNKNRIHFETIISPYLEKYYIK